MEDNQLAREDAKVEAFAKAYAESHPQVRATLKDVVDHIEHVVALAGVDHVGFGSDFDGVGDSLPIGLEDVSKYPELIRALLEKGHTEDEIEKMCSGNLFRVWDAVAAGAGGP